MKTTVSRTVTLLFGLIILLSRLGIAQSFDDEFLRRLTFGSLNGRAWAELDRSGKLWYLYGLHDGFRTGLTVGKIKESDFFICKCSMGEKKDGVDAFYAAEPARITVPVVTAVRAYVMKVDGATAAEIDEYVAGVLKVIGSERTP